MLTVYQCAPKISEENCFKNLGTLAGWLVDELKWLLYMCTRNIHFQVDWHISPKRWDMIGILVRPSVSGCFLGTTGTHCVVWANERNGFLQAICGRCNTHIRFHLRSLWHSVRHQPSSHRYSTYFRNGIFRRPTFLKCFLIVMSIKRSKKDSLGFFLFPVGLSGCDWRGFLARMLVVLCFMSVLSNQQRSLNCKLFFHAFAISLSVLVSHFTFEYEVFSWERSNYQ